MNEITILIIIFALLIPTNLLCTFWIFRELLNLSGKTFRELQKDFAAPTPFAGRYKIRRRQRATLNYLRKDSYDPEKTKVLFRRYLYSTFPSAAALLLMNYMALSTDPIRIKVGIAGAIILVIVNAVLLYYKGIYRTNNPLDRRIADVLNEKRSRAEKYSTATIIRYGAVCTIVGAIILTVIIVITLGLSEIAQGRVQSENQPGNNPVILLEHTNVNTVATNCGFETYNIPTTYWYIKEELLSYVVGGEKEGMKFEFYEYYDGQTAEEVYSAIWAELSSEIPLSDISAYEKELKGDGKIITFENDGIMQYLLCQYNSIIYAYAPVGNTEIDSILNELGCTVK